MCGEKSSLEYRASLGASRCEVERSARWDLELQKESDLRASFSRTACCYLPHLSLSLPSSSARVFAVIESHINTKEVFPGSENKFSLYYLVVNFLFTIL